MAQPTIDPASIQSAAQIPPPDSQFAGSSPQGLIDVYSGTVSGDVDAVPAAQELLASEPDTGSLVNAEYIYTQVSALYGGPQLPDLQSHSGNTVKSIIFVSGSSQGGYGAFHIPSSQTDFDRIVVDSLTVSGSYSSGSGLGAGAALAPAAGSLPRLFPVYRGPQGLLSTVDPEAASLKSATAESLTRALAAASQSRTALAKYIESHDASAMPTKGREPAKAKGQHHERARLLARTNQAVASLASVAATMGGGRQYLSTALFAAEIVESFELLTGKGNSGQTDGEAVSRVVGFKLAPEIALVPGFNTLVTQQWWSDGQPDYVNDNSQNDQSEDGNGAGVMFLLFLNDFLGVPMDTILAHMPATGGAPLGQTYVALLNDFPNLSQVAGADGNAAFQTMVSLLQQNVENPDGTLNLPANGNPYPSIPNSQQGGLFAGK